MVGKKIILAVTGSIAAYKAALLTRLLIKAGAEVQIIMTMAATDFITPLTLSTLSKKPVHHEVSSEESWNNHVELGLWADAMVVAPATATTLAKLSNGIADNMVVATYLSARCPVFFAPAMDLDMWTHPSTLENVRKLKSYGNHLIDVAHGELASGLVGNGRMAEPEDIVQTLSDFFSKKPVRQKGGNKGSLSGKQALVTAGPTYEPLDPVRFIGNRSTGKMGVAIAEELANRGANVKLVLGPSIFQTDHPNIELIRVTNAESMYKASKKHFAKSTITVLAAAVADYRPSKISNTKIKKKDKSKPLILNLERTTDIAATFGKTKKKKQIMVGFALETNNELENARGKLERKNFDFIVLNSLRDKGAGFAGDTNKITIVRKDNKIKKFELKSKVDVAVDIVNEVEEMLS